METKAIDHGDKLSGQDPHRETDDSWPEQLASESDERAPYATRVRVILGLSLLSWLLVGAAILWLIRRF